MDEERPLGRCIVTLKDGRRIDVSGLTIDAAVRRLRALNVQRGDVEDTTHYISREEITHGKNTTAC